MANRGRTIMYFDNSNIFHAQKNENWYVNVEKFYSLLEENGEIWQTYFFAAVTNPPRFGQENFYKKLKNDLKWEIVLFKLGQKTTKCKKCNCSWKTGAEKGVDVAIASKLLTHGFRKAYDTAILVSGDRDYLETVKTVKEMGLHVEIVSFRRSLSAELAKESSVPVLILDDYKSRIEWSKPNWGKEEYFSGDIAEKGS